MKNKVLYLIKTPPPVHGATVMNQYVHDSVLLRKNYDVRALTSHYASDVKEIGTKSFLKSLVVFNVLFKLFRELVSHRPHLIYFQISPIGAAFVRDFFYVSLIKIFNVKILFHLHGKGITHEGNKPFRKKMFRFVFRNEKIICLSEKLKYDIQEMYKGTPFVLPNGIPVDENPWSPDNNTSSTIQVTYLSNLIITKGIKDFLDALKLLNYKDLNYKAVIVGEEFDYTKKELLIFLEDNNFKTTIEYLGPQYGMAKKEILMRTDVFVFPTYYANESFPLVILEAMQAGLPVLSTFEGAIPEIVDDGVTGFLVEKQNPKALAAKIEILIKDKDLREKMGRAGRDKFLKKYTLDIFEQNLKNVFDEVLKDLK